MFPRNEESSQLIPPVSPLNRSNRAKLSPILLPQFPFLLLDCHRPDKYHLIIQETLSSWFTLLGPVTMSAKYRIWHFYPNQFRIFGQHGTPPTLSPNQIHSFMYRWLDDYHIIQAPSMDTFKYILYVQLYLYC